MPKIYPRKLTCEQPQITALIGQMSSIRCMRSMSFMFLVALVLSPFLSKGQVDYNGIDGRENVINTAVPFLRIAPDARTSALGNAGLALSPLNSDAVFSNLATIPFAKSSLGVAVNYTPWLREMSNDVFLAYLSAYKQLDSLQAVGVSLRYFDMGTVQLFSFDGADQGQTHPREFAIDAGYSRKLSEHWSLAAALRFIHSDLVSGTKADGQTYKPGTAVAGDISAYYQSPESKTGQWHFGAAITNLGSRVSYTEDGTNKYFLPANLGIGGAYTYKINKNNFFTLTLDVNKLLVPTPDTLDADADGILDFRQKSVVKGLFGSFGDAPNGFSEELHELMYSAGVEYNYDDLLYIRAGYYNEYQTKGNRKYVTVGFGLHYKMTGLGFSYLIPSGGSMQKNPLSNTVRISLSYNKF